MELGSFTELKTSITDNLAALLQLCKGYISSVTETITALNEH